MAAIAHLGVLLVEDDEDTRELIATFLRDEGALVRDAGTVEQAHELLREFRPDVILSDLFLPELDGLAFLSEVRANAATREIPAIAITGHRSETVGHQARMVGFQSLIYKPLQILRLPADLAFAAGIAVQKPSGDLDDLDDTALVRDLRGGGNSALLELVNARSTYRGASIMRFDGDEMTVVCGVERGVEDSIVDRSIGPITSSYCSFIARTGAPFVVADARVDSRVARHPRRNDTFSYCGVPLFRTDGSLFGSLCQYDRDPQRIDTATLTRMDRVAKIFSSQLIRSDSRN